MNLPVKIIIHNFAVLFCAFVYNIENSHTGCPNNDCFFSKAHCSYKNYPILKISSLLGWQ